MKQKQLSPIKAKRGSHVGTILSFVVFVSFIIFFYVISQPIISTQKGKDISLDNLKHFFREKLSTEVTELIIDVSETVPKPCVILRNIGGEFNIGDSVIAKNSKETILESYPSQRNSNSIVVERVSQDKRIQLSYSEDFKRQAEHNPIGPCPNILEGPGYTMRTILTNQRLSEKRIVENLFLYENDYDILAEELKVLKGDNFGFSFVYDNGTLIGTDESALNVEIKSEAITLLYVDQRGELKEGQLILKIW